MYGEKLPQSGRNIELEALSFRHLRNVLPPVWSYTTPERDYGVDLIVEIIENGLATGLQFNVQLKASDKLKTTQDHVIHRCRVSTANYLLRHHTPTMYLVYDARADMAYFIWIKDYLNQLQRTNPEWRAQGTVPIRLPISNRLGTNSALEITRYVRSYWRRYAGDLPPDVLPQIEQIRNPAVFISYSSRDRSFAERLARDLSEHGISTWFDAWEVKVGDSILDRISQGIDEHDYLAVVLTPDSVASPWVHKELEIGVQKQLAQGKPTLLPVLHKQCDIPAFLRGTHYADFTASYDEGFDEMIRVLAPGVGDYAGSAMFSVPTQAQQHSGPSPTFAYSVTSRKSGATYYLHSKELTLRGGRRQTIYYFARMEMEGALSGPPPGYTVMENERTGLPMLKRIGGQIGSLSQLRTTRLGPFYEYHGPEVVPTGLEDALEQLVNLWGQYRVESNLRELHNLRIVLDGYDITHEIQLSWDCTLSGESAFSFANLASREAAHGVICGAILRRLFSDSGPLGTLVDSSDRLSQLPEGIRGQLPTWPDGIKLVELRNGTLGAMLPAVSSDGYQALEKSIPRLNTKLRLVAQHSPNVEFMFLAMLDTAHRRLALLRADRTSFLSKSFHWPTDIITV